MESCHVCGGKLETLHAEVAEPETLEQFSILACRECGFGQTFPQPENLDAYYAEYHGKRHGFTADYCARRRMRWLEKSFKARGRVLDIGCGEGTFLDEANGRGWNGVGTELNAGKFHGSDLEVYEDLAQVATKYGAESFDAVTMWHTLEHFRNPREVLCEAFELLAPGGVLLVAVPDAGGWQARLFGKFWLHRDVPRHLFHFNFEALKTLLGECGFDIKTSGHQEFEYDLLGWSQSALNSMFRQPNVFFKALSGHRTNAGFAIRVVNFALGTLFSSFALPLVLLGTLRKKGGTIIVGAIKNETKKN
jgi:SAM-dependent methyltransferase